ncbi:MAG: hypothetical protein K8S98_07215 [Planctomycetes bacterium]|nr:hypothetical protein [Planctomycetota bacterium]
MTSSASRTSSATPWVWLVPTLGLALAALYWLERERKPFSSDPPTIASPDEAIPGFAARVELAHGALRVRLAPLHPDVVRQHFDALALARRLELGEGEPWRLTCSLDDADAPFDLDAPALIVRDREGIALEAIPLGASRDAAPSDPLRTLVAARSASLAPGESVDLVLWGRAPKADARLEGLGALGALPLEGTAYRRADLEVPLARLDVAGKSAASRSSAGAAAER